MVAVVDGDILGAGETANSKVAHGDIEPGEHLVILKALDARLEHVEHAQFKALHLYLRLLAQLHHEGGYGLDKLE